MRVTFYFAKAVRCLHFYGFSMLSSPSSSSQRSNSSPILTATFLPTEPPISNTLESAKTFFQGMIAPNAKDALGENDTILAILMTAYDTQCEILKAKNSELKLEENKKNIENLREVYFDVKYAAEKPAKNAGESVSTANKGVFFFENNVRIKTFANNIKKDGASNYRKYIAMVGEIQRTIYSKRCESNIAQKGEGSRGFVSDFNLEIGNLHKKIKSLDENIKKLKFNAEDYNKKLNNCYNDFLDVYQNILIFSLYSAIFKLEDKDFIELMLGETHTSPNGEIPDTIALSGSTKALRECLVQNRPTLLKEYEEFILTLRAKDKEWRAFLRQEDFVNQSESTPVLKQKTSLHATGAQFPEVREDTSSLDSVAPSDAMQHATSEPVYSPSSPMTTDAIGSSGDQTDPLSTAFSAATSQGRTNETGQPEQQTDELRKSVEFSSVSTDKVQQPVDDKSGEIESAAVFSKDTTELALTQNGVNKERTQDGQSRHIKSFSEPSASSSMHLNEIPQVPNSGGSAKALSNPLAIEHTIRRATSWTHAGFESLLPMIGPMSDARMAKKINMGYDSFLDVFIPDIGLLSDDVPELDGADHTENESLNERDTPSIIQRATHTEQIEQSEAYQRQASISHSHNPSTDSNATMVGGQWEMRQGFGIPRSSSPVEIAENFTDEESSIASSSSNSGSQSDQNPEKVSKYEEELGPEAPSGAYPAPLMVINKKDFTPQIGAGSEPLFNDSSRASTLLDLSRQQLRPGAVKRANSTPNFTKATASSGAKTVQPSNTSTPTSSFTFNKPKGSTPTPSLTSQRQRASTSTPSLTSKRPGSVDLSQKNSSLPPLPPGNKNGVHSARDSGRPKSMDWSPKIQGTQSLPSRNRNGAHSAEASSTRPKSVSSIQEIWHTQSSPSRNGNEALTAAITKFGVGSAESVTIIGGQSEAAVPPNNN